MKKSCRQKNEKELLKVLQNRFEKNMNRHKDLLWAKVQAKLEANTEKLWSLNEMERTGGEPDVIGTDNKTGEFIFVDCSQKPPKTAEMSVMIAKRWTHGRNINQKIPPWIWQLPWVIEIFNRRTIPGAAEAWGFRYEDIELVENTP